MPHEIHLLGIMEEVQMFLAIDPLTSGVSF